MSVTYTQLRGFVFATVFLLVNLPQLQVGTVAQAAQFVGGTGATQDGQVAATPISIPRPIRLERIMKISGAEQPNTAPNMSKIAIIGNLDEAIEACELVTLQLFIFAVRQVRVFSVFSNGVPGGIRTPDSQVRSRSLNPQEPVAVGFQSE
ncbi:MAG: hypothetical protein IH612_02495 [Desulfofustis sp.]|nr:hypothetical protein [Desulfofustis sp.]